MKKHDLEKIINRAQYDTVIHAGPNPNGQYPVCMSVIGGNICACCGNLISKENYDKPCPGVKPEDRWGPDVHEKIINRAQYDTVIHAGPNPNGRYPVCMSVIGRNICARCGNLISKENYDKPCPGVKPEDRWGPDVKEK